MDYVRIRYFLTRHSWHRDIDTKSLQYANKNVDLNNVAPRIQLLETLPEGPLLPSELFDHGRYIRFMGLIDKDWISACAIPHSTKTPTNCTGMLEKSHWNLSPYRSLECSTNSVLYRFFSRNVYSRRRSWLYHTSHGRKSATQRASEMVLYHAGQTL